MRDQEIVSLYEAYQKICESSVTITEDEMEKDPLLNLSYVERAKRLKDKAEKIRSKGGKTRTEEIELDEEAPERIRKRSKNPRLMKDAGPARVHNPKKEDQKESYDLFDTILEHLVAEGYADTEESALVIMANMSEEWREDIMEISQKTATRAYADSSTGEFEGQDSPRDVRRTDRLRGHIERKFGKKAAKHADRAAHARTFGRKGAGGMGPKP
jgi:hypothetical protein